METSRPSSLLNERHALNMKEFASELGKSRFWHLMPEGKSDVKDSTGLFDPETRIIVPSVSLRAFLDQHPFSYLLPRDGDQQLATLHSNTRLLWNNETSAKIHNLSDASKIVKEERWAGLEGWRLPTKDKLFAFATHDNNPHRYDKFVILSRLKSPDGYAAYDWLTAGGEIDTRNKGCEIKANGTGRIFACHTLWENASDAEILVGLATFGWRLSTPNGATFFPGIRTLDLSDEAIVADCAAKNLQLRAYDNDKLVLDPRCFWIPHQMIDLDYTPCRLPKLDNAQLTDPEKGLWELWGEDEATLKHFGLVARNPERDLHRRAVAIDFGTSSTVVAMDMANGGRELLRIGVRDYFQAVQAEHFENPTVLECLDFPEFQRVWTNRAYRPELDWNTMRAAHEAQTSFRDNPGDTRVLASILPRLKQWALRSDSSRIRLTDRKGHEIELAAHTERNPIRGQALAVSPDDPFDPIELYAWYLGMAINWRGRGLFLKYYLSFPVKYPSEAKNRVLASFRRGLQRSLPHSLITHYPQVLNEFEVIGLASEPAAYAAAALPQLKLEPTDDGLPYAVFDFGGGTTDFDFGLLRWATPNEEAQGYERVFEHLDSSGDNFLGGENLLENLVYATFQNNISVLREHRIQFTKPLDALPFDGSEAFLAPTQAAQTNTVMLAAKLRSFMESATPNLPAQLKIDFIDTAGNKKPCELTLDSEYLDALLASRMRDGVKAFLYKLSQLHDKFPKDTPIHVLLSGNGSRSRHITALFSGDLWKELLTSAFGETPPEIIVYPPLPIDERNAHAPTAKTGVALGLLRLMPGENTLLINHVHDRHDGQAPFAWYVGRLSRGRFKPVLLQGADYNQWHELGILQQCVFNLFSTTSPRAQDMPEGHQELRKRRLEFPETAPAGSKLFARAISPDTIELAAAPDINAAKNAPVMKCVLG